MNDVGMRGFGEGCGEGCGERMGLLEEMLAEMQRKQQAMAAQMLQLAEEHGVLKSHLPGLQTPSSSAASFCRDDGRTLEMGRREGVAMRKRGEREDGWVRVSDGLAKRQRLPPASMAGGHVPQVAYQRRVGGNEAEDEDEEEEERRREQEEEDVAGDGDEVGEELFGEEDVFQESVAEDEWIQL